MEQFTNTFLSISHIRRVEVSSRDRQECDIHSRSKCTSQRCFCTAWWSIE
jgi:hypothetical protein